MRAVMIFALLLVGCGDPDRPPGIPNGGQCTEGEVRACTAPIPGPSEFTGGVQVCSDRAWGACAPNNDGGRDGD